MDIISILLKLLISISSLVHISHCENILALAFFASKSHKNVFDPLYIALAQRGHTLTVVSPIKSSYHPQLKMKEINGPGMEEIMQSSSNDSTSLPDIFNLRSYGLNVGTPINPILIPLLTKACELYFEMAEVKALLKQKFALVFIPSHMNECTYGFVHKLNVPYIFVHPHSMENYKTAFSGLRPSPAVVPSYTVPWAQEGMGIAGRTLNFIAYHSLNFIYDWIYLPKMESIFRRYLGSDLPSAREIEKNASLAFMNGHFSLSGAKPKLPVLVDVAGIHCRPGQTLPQVRNKQ
jgi:glucuronosyltransferase